MTYSSACRIEIHTLLFCEVLNLRVLLQVLLGLILYIVVQCHYNLVGIVNLGCADRHELRRYGPGVVVGHAVVWRKGHIVARLDNLALSKTQAVALNDLLGQSLRRRWRDFLASKQVGRSVFEEGVKGAWRFGL